MINQDNGIAMTIGVALGSIVSRILINKNRREEMKYEEASSIRKELRIDIAHMNDKIEHLSCDLDQWKDRYYRLADENLKLRLRCRALEIELEDLKNKVDIQNKGRLLSAINIEVDS